MKELPKVLRTPQFFTILFDQLLDDYVVDIWNQALATVACTFCRPHLEKVVWTRQSFFFTIFMLNPALATVSCTFCPPHLQKVVCTRQFFANFLCEIELLWRARFVDLIFEKWSGPVSFFCVFCVNSSLVHILLTSSWKSGPDPSVFCDCYVKSSSCYSRVHVLSTSSSKSSLDPSFFLRFLCEIELLLRSLLQEYQQYACHIISIYLFSTILIGFFLFNLYIVSAP